jgi:putative SOS response-associated peptidase YedK
VCNLYTLEKGPDAIRRLFEQAQMPLTFPEGVPNLEPRDIRITDRAPIVRFNRQSGAAELVERRWSWPGPHGKPVFNMRSDGREFGHDRCLAIADGFYEFTKPVDPKKKRKDCFLFRPAGETQFAIAGILRTDPAVGEAFTLLTVPPGPDVAPYHNRQIALVSLPQWQSWLDGSASSKEILRPGGAGELSVTAQA